MSDLNTACIADDFASDLTKNLETDVDDAESRRCVKATVHDKLHEEQCMMTMYSECVWESCYTVPVKPINSKISKRKLHQNRKGESDDRLKTQNHVKQKYDAKCNKKTKASNKTKKSKLGSPEKANLDRGIDTTLPAEKALLQAADAKASPVVSGSTCAITDCIESVAVDLNGRSCYLLSDGFECDQEEKTSACNDDGVNVLETAPHSVPICQDLIALSDKNIFAENSDENKNILNDGILLETACQESVEYTALLNYCDLAPGNRDLTVQCTVNDFIEHTVTECEANTFAQEQQPAAVLNKSKRRRSLRLMAGLRTNLEQADEKQDCSELGGLSAVEEHKGCTENPSMQDANVAGHEDQNAGFVKDMPNTITTPCLPSITADEQMSSQRLVDDDLDDFTELPIFTKRSSRRLRRTSMEIYRKSLHDAENIASEEECDTMSVCQDSSTANDATATDVDTTCVDTASTNDVVFCDKLALLPTELENSVTLPVTAVENVEMQSDVQTAKLTSVTNSNSINSSTTDLSLTNITNGRRQRRSAANSQASVNVPVTLPPKTRQRNPSASVQDIYLNRLWRSQMPKEKALESIPELPTSEQRGSKVTKRVRCLKFDDVPNKTKLRQRRQMAVKNGWKPLTKKQNMLLDSQLLDKLAELEHDLM